jgi:hypothetical protein
MRSSNPKRHWRTQSTARSAIYFMNSTTIGGAGNNIGPGGT